VRYQHYITSPKVVKWPGAVVCVAVNLEHSGASSAVHRSASAKCVSALKLLTLNQENYQLTKEILCTSPEQFWTVLQQLSTKEKRLWVLSDHCGDAWHALDFWGMLEDGHISVAGSDPRGGCNSRYAKGNGYAGYLCIEDPPNVAKFRFAGETRSITWVDVRNYGVQLDDTISDCSAVANWLADWFTCAADIVASNKLGSWCATAGSQAMHGWRASYKSTGVLAHVHPQASALESQAYYGGRCEAYNIGSLSGTWHQLDFRSMYSSICSSQRVPVRLSAFTCNEFSCYHAIERSPEQCIADVELDTDSPDYPYRAHLPLQLYGNSNGSGVTSHPAARHTEIIYPTGRFTTTLCGPELKHALESNHVRDIHSIATYEMEPALAEYARAIYDVRGLAEQSGIRGLSDYVKSLLVSLPGKFGQRERLWIDCPNHSGAPRYGTWYGTDRNGHTARYRSIAGHVQRDVCLGFAPDSCPALAGFVTSEGRISLLRAIRKARSRNVCYCDTDGIICNDDAFRNLESADMVRNGELGYLRWIQTADGCTIHGVKHYDIGKTSRNAGVSKSALNGTSGTIHRAERRRIREDIYSGLRPANGACKSNNGGHSIYHGGRVMSDGTVRPWHVKDGVIM
jgi:hypothetical protein